MNKLNYSLFFVIIFTILIPACEYGKSQESPQKKLVGEWRNVSVNVTMNSVNGSDTSQLFEANQQNWEEKLGIQPIRTSFNDDGSYVSKYFTPDDSLIRQSSGSWENRNDLLYMYQTYPDSVIYISALSIQTDTARFETTLDWDQDGAKDDHYVGVQYRHSE